jgi:hypothetical protein
MMIKSESSGPYPTLYLRRFNQLKLVLASYSSRLLSNSEPVATALKTVCINKVSMIAD